jgi:hypothetical protein
MQNMSGNSGRWLIIAGIFLIITGVIIRYAPWLVSWFGKLPGDIRIEKENSRVYFPITSMVIISIVLTILVNVIRLLKR